MARLRHDRITIPPPGSGAALRLAVVADTHSQPHPAAAQHLRAWAPHAILHAGDIGDLAVLEALAEVAPVHAVRGNIDVRAATLPDLLTIDLGDALRILLVHIGVAGVRLRADVGKVARAERARLVICGHSHIPFIGEDRGLLIFNPGSVGPRRFHLPIVFGTLTLPARGSSPALAHVDAATGAPWTPMAHAS
ncbi:MAG TPA: metallophosphoesterase family protein [Kofleriaceae bacterium]|nr:metallophosphoesterase family protein [Kofleriaceae bacterium]